MNENSNYYSCSFLATEGSMFFVNHTASKWEEDECCLFAKVYKTIVVVVVVVVVVSVCLKIKNNMRLQAIL